MRVAGCNRETIQPGVSDVLCVDDMEAVIRCIIRCANVATQGGFIGRPVSVLASGFRAGKAAVDVDACFQVERERAVGSAGRLVRAFGHPDFVAGVGHEDGGLQVQERVRPVPAVARASRGILVHVEDGVLRVRIRDVDGYGVDQADRTIIIGDPQRNGSTGRAGDPGSREVGRRARGVHVKSPAVVGEIPFVQYDRVSRIVRAGTVKRHTAQFRHAVRTAGIGRRRDVDHRHVVADHIRGTVVVLDRQSYGIDAVIVERKQRTLLRAVRHVVAVEVPAPTDNRVRRTRRLVRELYRRTFVLRFRRPGEGRCRGQVEYRQRYLGCIRFRAVGDFDEDVARIGAVIDTQRHQVVPGTCGCLASDIFIVVAIAVHVPKERERIQIGVPRTGGVER